MNCTACGAPVIASQNFCMSCGRAVEQLPPPVLAPLSASPPAAAPPGVGAVPGALPPPTTAVPHGDTTWTVVEQTPSPALDDTMWRREGAGAAAPTAVFSPQGSPVAPTGVQPVTPARRARVTLLVVLAVLTAGVLGAALAVTTYTIEIDNIRIVAPKLGDMFSNNTLVVVIAVAAMLAGAIGSALGSRLWSGVAGGTGLAVAGFVAMQIAVIIQEFDSAGFDRIASGGSILVRLTRDVGFWLLVAAAAVGVITFFVSLRQAGEDYRTRIEPTVALFGAFAAAVLALGALIPQNGVAFVRNFSDDFVPPATLYLRLGSMLLLLVTGVVGFLIQRRWGVGMVLGGLAVSIAQWATTVTADQSQSVGSVPLGVSMGNLGNVDGRPHPATTAGLIATIVFAALALALATRAQKRHEAQ
jgi:uncharacterized membrane protein